MKARKPGRSTAGAKALSHPLRVRILQALEGRAASPVELAREFDERLGNVSYHVRALLDLGCIRLVDTKQRRGALEHFYTATVRLRVVVEEIE